MRVFNAVGELLRRWHWDRPLSVDRILNAAQRGTGLQDFGGDDFLEPLQLLVDDFQQHARLHPFGKIFVERMLTGFARNRLLIQDACRRHPEHLTQSLRTPLYVVGLPRTGTTLLYNLLCQDPHARPLLFSEITRPVPSQREEARGSRGRPSRRQRFVANFLMRVAPNLNQKHPLEPDGPEECGWLLCNTFVSDFFFWFGELPRSMEYIRSLPHERRLRIYEYYRRTLQLMQGGQGARHWTLKSPAHLGMLPELLAAIPTANVALTHRDPMQAIPSCCSVVTTMRTVLSDHVEPRRCGLEFADFMAFCLSRAEDAAKKYGERMCDVCYEQLLRDPIGVVRGIYARFGYDYSEQMEAGMRRWLASHPQHKHGVHRYELEQFGLAPADIAQRFGDYWSRTKTRLGAG